MQHTTSGNALMTPRSVLGPRETSILEDFRPKTNLLVFPGAKTNNFKLTMATPTPDVLGPSPSPAQKGGISFSPFRSSTSVKRSSSMLNPSHSPIMEEEQVPSFQKSRSMKSQSGVHTPQDYIRVRPLPEDLPSSPPPPVFRQNLSRQSVSPSQSIMANITNASQATPHANVETHEHDRRSPPGASRSSSQFNIIKLQTPTHTMGLSTYMSTDTFFKERSTPSVHDNPMEDHKGVNIPANSKPVIITPEVERLINMKSRLGYDTPNTARIHDADIEQSYSSEHSVKDGVNDATLKSKIDATGNSDTLFKTLEPGEGTVSKMAEDVILLNTPENDLNSGRTTANDVTLPEIPSPAKEPVSLSGPQLTSSPVGGASPVPRHFNLYTSPIKAVANETEKLYSMDIDLI
ncbi:hypothetical protein MAR_025223 [Mya arenaria]|uniref:Uncharacterized protein n=2 Tax=Mya arenaria TaxID=6604 RepID=A0ABY7E115_MYAAR|nr:hypothetical protein MAR_025223 [Mya arenaria]